MAAPLAYFITFTCYGTWLHGDDRESVDRHGHNVPGAPFVPASPGRHAYERSELAQPPYALDAARRRVVLATVKEVCAHRGWDLLAAHVRSNHVHVIVSGDAPPERMMNDLKAYASRRLNEAGCDPPGRARWTRHGSTVYLWTAAQLDEKVRYVVYGQGEPMEVSYRGEAPSEARPSGRDVADGTDTL